MRFSIKLANSTHPSQIDPANIVSATIERGIDIDKIDLSAVTVRQEPGEDVLVVAVEEQALSGVLLARGVEDFYLLGRVSGDVVEGALAHPVEHGPAFGLTKVDLLLFSHETGISF
jgi:hypothetical protein